MIEADRVAAYGYAERLTLSLEDLAQAAKLLPRVVDALERIAEALEVQSRPGAFRTRYQAPEGVEGDLLVQSDADFAEVEKVEREKARTGYEAEAEYENPQALR